MSYQIQSMGSYGGAMSQQTFVTKVLPLFGVALLVAAIGVYWGQFLPREVQFGVIIAELALVFTSGLWQRKQGLNSLLFFAYALCSGITLVPLLTYAALQGGLALISEALTVTTVTFGGLALYGLTTRRDFSGIGNFLFMGAIGLIIASLLNAFLFHSGMVGLLMSVVGVGVFGGFVVYDMAMIRRRFSEADTVGAALGLFIDFIGLFTFILRLLMAFNNRDD